ncbi:hypothetical protein SAMN05216489_04083 [Streptomyces sp. 3213]|uniref:hypothetical protein n=1 Tax=Streptomyces sp. 3213.3 TaxID=1855348 RepID=UPI00089B88A6|nr:hypothetical protein [Streptomyces sp. 3213.3]SED67297.1 hypothetical protein SAMN05216489_04083 [Streptomyces sp. 3213] [Streptomyces sp. 3213.3]
MSRDRTRLVRARRTWRGIAGAVTAVVLVGGGFAVANASTDTQTGKSAAGVKRPVDKKATGVGAVVSAANEFLNTLAADQQASTLLDLTQANATAWSNLH